MSWDSFFNGVEKFVQLGTATGFIYCSFTKVKLLFEPKKLDSALKKLEEAIVETHSFISGCDTQTSNRNLERLWKEARTALKNVNGLEEIAGIAFEKELYWQNPRYYTKENPKRTEEIKLIKVKEKLSELRVKIARNEVE